MQLIVAIFWEQVECCCFLSLPIDCCCFCHLLLFLSPQLTQFVTVAVLLPVVFPLFVTVTVDHCHLIVEAFIDTSCCFYLCTNCMFPSMDCCFKYFSICCCGHFAVIVVPAICGCCLHYCHMMLLLWPPQVDCWHFSHCLLLLFCHGWLLLLLSAASMARLLPMMWQCIFYHQQPIGQYGSMFCNDVSIDLHHCDFLLPDTVSFGQLIIRIILTAVLGDGCWQLLLMLLHHDIAANTMMPLLLPLFPLHNIAAWTSLSYLPPVIVVSFVAVIAVSWYRLSSSFFCYHHRLII